MTDDSGPNQNSRLTNLQISAKHIRRIVLEQSYRAGVGHIGSNLSVSDILSVIYSRLVTTDSGRDRDRFILSKGHAALALYATLNCLGRISREQLNSFCNDGTLLGVHPEHQLEGVDFSTGSLGMGLSFGVGAALAARLQRSLRHIYILLSDAECNEGAIWEGAAMAAHRGLDNLTVFIDVNGQQALGYTRDVVGECAAPERWASFGWDARVVDGHDEDLMETAVRRLRDGRPRVLLCRTVFGRGVSFMEGKIEWHYLPMTAEQYEIALSEIERQT
jgi:transketolase